MEVLGLVTFMLTMSISPGPNTIMIAQSGMNFGFQKSIPHILGITLGFTFLAVLVSMGIGKILTDTFPAVLRLIRFFGASYLIYLAFRTMFASSRADQGGDEEKALSFLESFLFQFSNPKGWLMAIVASAFFTKSGNPNALDYLLYSTLLILVLGPCVVAWNLFGLSLRRLLSRPTHRVKFNIGMTIMLLVSALDLIVN